VSVEDWVTAYHERIYKYCCYMLRHPQEAEDAVQEVFLRAWRSSEGKAEEPRSVQAWLYRIAHNHCLNRLKRRRLLVWLPFRPEWPERSAEPAATQAAASIDELLGRLAPLDRSIVLLRLAEERPYEEIGAAVGLTPGAVRKRFERARKRLQASIQRKGGVARETESIPIV